MSKKDAHLRILLLVRCGELGTQRIFDRPRFVECLQARLKFAT